MKNEVAPLMNNEKLMKIFATAKIHRNYSLFTIHYSFIKRYVINAVPYTKYTVGCGKASLAIHPTKQVLRGPRLSGGGPPNGGGGIYDAP